MKASSRLFLLLILVFVTINTLAQNRLEDKKSIYLHLGASGGYSPNLSKPFLLPQFGFDATFGTIGFRANAQFFKTSPEFDINGYLDPIKSVLTISNLQENNSNVLFGFTPYLNIEKKALSIQPGVGLKYLIQKGATATAVYYQTPASSILKFPDGKAKRNLFVIEPNIRASFGKPNNILRFFIEAGYAFPVGKNEISYSSRSLTGVIDPRGNVDVKALLDSKTILATEKSLPAFASVGAGLEIKLFSKNEQDKPREQHLGFVPIKPAKSSEDKQNTINILPQFNKPDNQKDIQRKLVALTPKNNISVEKVSDLGWFSWELVNEKISNPKYVIEVKQIDNHRNTIKTYSTKTSDHKATASTLFGRENIAYGNYQWQVTETTTGLTSGTMYFNFIPCIVNLSLSNIQIECLGIVGSDFKYKICFNSTYQSSTGNLTFANQGSGLSIWNQNNASIFSTASPNLLPQAGSVPSTVNYCFEVIVPASTTQIGFGLIGDDLNPSPVFCIPGASYSIDSLPTCLCTKCESVQISIPTQGTVSMDSTLWLNTPVIVNPAGVKHIKTQLVYFEYKPETDDCVPCNHDSRDWGKFISGTLSDHEFPQNAWLTHNNELRWNSTSTNGASVNGNFNLNISMPPLVKCCKADLKFCIRYIFEFADCTVCEKVVCYFYSKTSN